MSVILPSLSIEPVGTAKRDRPSLSIEMRALNGHADHARGDVLRAISVVLDAMLLRCGEEGTMRFLGVKRDQAQVLCVPKETAKGRIPHPGLAKYFFTLDFGANQLEVSASAQGETAATIAFEPRVNESRETLWIPKHTNYGGQTKIVGVHAIDPNVRQAGHDQLMRAAAKIGDIATAASAAMGADGDLAPQLQVLARSHLG